MEQTQIIQNPNIGFSDEEAFFLLGDKTMIEMVCREITHKITESIETPRIRIKIDNVVSGVSSSFIYDMVLSDFGFQLRSVDENNRIIAHNIFNKNLVKDFDCIDIEFLRGLASLVLLSLEKMVMNNHIEIYGLIFSPHFTEYLYTCKEFIRYKKGRIINR